MCELKTISDFDITKLGNYVEGYNYGNFNNGFNLTDKLDSLKADTNFNQEILNEIVLWKVNRYVSLHKSDWLIDFNALKDLESIESNMEKIISVLDKMLLTKGIALPMASTLLRFRNPKTFQIIDARTFRVVFGKNDLPKSKIYNSNSNKRSQKSKLYLEYLISLRYFCEDKYIEFEQLDRILYQFDKIENSGIPINE
jgi:hypothetical protein